MIEKNCQGINSSATYKPLQEPMSRWSTVELSDEDIRTRVKEIWESLLHDPEYGFTLQTAEDEACFFDTGNNDVRTEGQSYGMLLAVLLDDKVFFDNVWRWSLRHMYLTEGPCRGYFAWSVPLDGRPRAEGPAPDGEIFFCLALILAHKRWGSAGGDEDYAGWAQTILRDMLHRGDEEAPPMIQDNDLIAFVPGLDFTDPSYMLPHAFELFAEYCNERDKLRWQKVAATSRDFLFDHAHPETGLYPEYALNDGRPEPTRGHPNFYSDAYRCMINLAVDSINCGKREEASDIAKRQAEFFFDRNPDERWLEFTVAGEPTGQPSLHPVGLQASLACCAILSDDEASKHWEANFAALPLRQGDRRYYDNLLYFFSFLALSGWYVV